MTAVAPHHRPAIALLCLGLLLPTRALHAQLPAGTSDASSSASSAPAPPDTRAVASAALEHGDFAAAVRLLAPLAEANPNDAHILFNLASAQDALAETPPQISAATTTYRRAIAADPVYFEPHLALGLLLARTGQNSDAQTELTTAATLSTPDTALKARAWRALAHLDQTNDPAAARDALLEALKLSPETPDDTLLSASLAEKSNDPAAAEAAYRRTLAHLPDDPDATAALAHLLVTQQKLAEADTLLTEALAKHPADPPLTAELVALRLRQQRPAEAATLLAPLSQQHPGDLATGRLYARLLAQGGDFPTADQVLAPLTARHPDDGPLLDQRADVLIHLKRYTEAQTLLHAALNHPESFSSRQDMAEVAGRLAFADSVNNDPAGVLQALALRATVLPQSPSSLFLEATAHDKLHHLKQSKELYRQFLSSAGGKFPDEEWEARHRLLALEHTH